jgi:DNA polymerase I-like protein with 3'-5' exonuclease and polymerase domains
MLQYAIDNDNTIVGWNVTFDAAWLIALGLEDLVMKAKWLDGMLLWRHLTIEPEYDALIGKKKSYGLKAAVKEFLPAFAGYEEDVDFFDDAPEALEKLHKYNQLDAEFTLRITKQLYSQLSPTQLNAALIEAESIPLIAQANTHGMLVDVDAANKLIKQLDRTAAEIFEQLKDSGVTETIIRSPKKLGELIYDDWKLPCSQHTDTGARAVGKEALYELSFLDPRAKLLKEYREALNNKTKFAEVILDAVAYNGTGYVHPEAKIFGTYSGRLTYSSSQGYGVNAKQTGFALHQMKRGKEYRSLIKAPPGYTLLEYDASGQEFRLMALASGDPTMQSLCAPGMDAHQYMGDQIDPHADDKKASRQLGKIANLSLGYRTSAKKLRSVARVQYNLPMDIIDAERIHKAYQNAYPGVPAFWNNQIKETKNNGFVETFAGRRVTVTGDWNGKNSWSMGSTSINFRIQGSGADQKYLALKILKPYFIEKGIRFAWDLHDGLYLYVPSDIVAGVTSHIKQLLDALPYQHEWGFTPTIPLTWDAKEGPSWGELKEVKFAEDVVEMGAGDGDQSIPLNQPVLPQGGDRDRGTHAGLSKSNTVDDTLIQVDFRPQWPKSNEEFLAAVFGERHWKNAWVSNGAIDNWNGGRAAQRITNLDTSVATYYVVSEILPGHTRRKEEDTGAQFVIPLDDIGIKLDLLTAQSAGITPSYIVETSPNNHQWGFLLKTPEADPARLKTFWNGLKESKFAPATDCSDRARYIRMPFGNSAKEASKGFVTRIVGWDPDERYTLDQLAAAFGIPFRESDIEDTRQSLSLGYVEPLTQDEVDNDLLYSIFKSAGRIRKGMDGDGKVSVVCPWESDHTTGADTAAYWPHRDKFKCHHGHCQDKTTNDVLTRFLADPVTAPHAVDAMFDDQFAVEVQEALIEEQETVAKEELDAEFDITPFKLIDPAEIPPREWLYGNHYIRKFISASVAPGGIGKSSIVMVEAVSMAIGRGLLHHEVTEPLKVWYWNGEDPADELQRRFAAIILYYGLTTEEKNLLTRNLWVDDGRQLKIKIATQDKTGTKICTPIVKATIKTLKRNKIDVVCIDPFVASHKVQENDNNAIEEVAEVWRDIADSLNCAIELVHHTRKTNGNEVTVEDGRGASALSAASRAARAFNKMTEDEANRAGINPDRRGFYVREYDGKTSMVPPASTSTWYQLHSQMLPNGTFDRPGDNVGVPGPWEWVSGTDTISDHSQAEIFAKLSREKHNADVRSAEWAGIMIAEVMGLNIHNPQDRGQIQQLIKDWLAKKMLQKIQVSKAGKSSKEKTWLLKPA